MDFVGDPYKNVRKNPGTISKDILQKLPVNGNPGDL